MRRRTAYLTLLAFLTAFLAASLAGCAAPRVPHVTGGWRYDDLRGLGAVTATQPSLNPVALYTRQAGGEVQMRVDFLGHAPLPDYDLYIAIDSQPGGGGDLPVAAKASLDWDTLLVIPASGPLEALDSRLEPLHGSGLRVFHNPELDTLSLSLNQEILFGRVWPTGWMSGGSFRVQVFVAPGGQKTVAGELGPLSSQALPPPPAQALLAFWDSYPAYTPATALRRWDGAHTGPFGGRHGLYNLLRAAQHAQAPLALLDLKDPASLSALDYGGYRTLIDEMLSEGLLILPDPLPDSRYGAAPFPEAAIAPILGQNRAIAADFGLPPSPFAYTPDGPPQALAGARVLFTRQTEAADASAGLTAVRAGRWEDKLVLPVAVDGDLPAQAGTQGPTLELRRALIEAAQAAAKEPSNPPVLVLGGDLPSSAWGDAQSARSTFHYLAAHPWVRLLNANDLLALAPSPLQGSSTAPLPPGSKASNLAASLATLADSPLRRAAWQAFQAQYAAVYPYQAALPALRCNYHGEAWSLFEAARWAESPTEQARCDLDPNRDGKAECILSSQDVYALFEIDSGALTMAFMRSPQGGEAASVHQVVAPSGQFISGLSDPAVWDLSQGSRADPEAIAGAFAEPERHYRAQVNGDSLVFTSADGAAVKTYRLTPQGVRMDYHFSAAAAEVRLLIPAALDPWRRFSSGWADAYQERAGSKEWTLKLAAATGADSSIQAVVISSAELTGNSFLSSRPFMAQTEDPNIDYPAGHFLPFPMAIVEASDNKDFWVSIEVTP